MSSHHDHDHHATETKPVAFRTPLILGLVTIFLILLLVSTCDGGHHGECECKENCSEECMKKCEAGDHSGHEAEAEEHHAAATHEEAPATEESAKDTTAVHSVDTTAHAAEPAAPAHH